MEANSPSPAEESAPPSARRVRSAWLIATAVLALAGLLFSLASMQAGKTQTSALPSNLQANPVAVGLYNKLADTSATQAKSYAVKIQNYAYSPATITVAVGDTITWTNYDTAPHTVTVSDGPVKFNSPNLEQGQTFSYTFTQAGTYNYYCAVHPDMKASVTVTAAETTAPSTSTVPTTSEPTSSMSMPSSPSSATTSESSSMSMPSTTSGSTTCVSKDMLSAFWAHIESAHLEQSPLQQVQGLLDTDNYVKLHTVWLEQVLKPLMDGTAQQVGADTLSAFWAHIESAHLDQSPMQQVQGLLDLDNYVKLHTVWLEQVLKPTIDQLTC